MIYTTTKNSSSNSETERNDILNSVKVQTYSLRKPIRSRGSLIVKARGSIFGGTRKSTIRKKSKKIKITSF